MCNFCLKLIGCICCFLFLLALVVCLIISYFYAVYVPKFPSYEVEKFTVNAFDIQPDSIISAEIFVAIRAENPNSNIGFIYGQNGIVSLVFNDSDVLCSGRTPYFHQGHNNVTVINVDMFGKGPISPGLQATYEENQRSHRPVPLMVKVELPVRVVLEQVPLKEFKVHVNSSLVVDNLIPNKKTTIVSRDTMYNFDL